MFVAWCSYQSLWRFFPRMTPCSQSNKPSPPLSDDTESDPDLPVDLIDAWYGLGTDARMLFSHLVALHDAGFYAMRSFALQLRHIDLALDKLWKSRTPWDYVELHMQMKTSCGVLQEQLALLNEELDKIHTVVEASRIDATGIEKVIHDMHRTLILSFDEGQELENLTFVHEDLMGVVDLHDSVLTFIARPIPFEIRNKEELMLLEDGGVKHPSIYDGSKERLQGYADTLEAYGDFDAVQRNDA
ncbi:hypothetical protein EDD85DRAFT_603231 [Armillaria nabsnona]|nr:hypothetical protein EDD85DRAFT_603231 [Armillaria nabsnona]